MIKHYFLKIKKITKISIEETLDDLLVKKRRRTEVDVTKDEQLEQQAQVQKEQFEMIRAQQESIDSLKQMLAQLLECRIVEMMTNCGNISVGNNDLKYTSQHKLNKKD